MTLYIKQNLYMNIKRKLYVKDEIYVCMNHKGKKVKKNTPNHCLIHIRHIQVEQEDREVIVKCFGNRDFESF